MKARNGNSSGDYSPLTTAVEPGVVTLSMPDLPDVQVPAEMIPEALRSRATQRRLRLAARNDLSQLRFVTVE